MPVVNAVNAKLIKWVSAFRMAANVVLHVPNEKPPSIWSWTTSGCETWPDPEKSMREIIPEFDAKLGDEANKMPAVNKMLVV